ncbi:MAG: AMP-binding protein [Ruminiclostridium sp.]|nr:AMP-binding protein [Ruminiclostridium sp.]
MNFYDDIERYSDRVAVTDDSGRDYTYAEIAETGERICENIHPRSLVFLVCGNDPASIAAYVGFLRRRIVPVLISPKTDGELFGQLLAKYSPGYIFCPKEFYGKGERLTETGEFHLLKTGNAPVPVSPELAVLITTSGSTGSPKFVRQSYKNIDSNSGAIAEYLKITEDDRAITTMPMNYTYGLSIIQSHLLMGARIIATEKTLMDKGFWSLLKEQEATTFGGVPYIYQMLKRLRFGRMELPSLRYITQAGGRLSKELGLEFAEICKGKGIEFIIMYGQTEATARMSYLPWEYAFTKAGSIGIPIPGGEMYPGDEDGREITTPGMAGELIYKGDNVALGYAECAGDLTKGDEFGGVLRTGDMVVRDEDGYFTVVGRKKRFLKIFGNRVNLDEAEGLLCKNGFECVCGGRDDMMRIYMVNADDTALKNAEEFIGEKTGLNRSAFKAISVSEIPRNDSGKILYSKLEERVET